VAPRADWRDVIGGLVFVAVGIAFAAGALELPLGDARRMGPGYLPLAVSLAAIALGLLIAIPALRRAGGPLPPIEWRPFLAVIGAMGAFGLAMATFGLLPAVAAAALTSALGDGRSRPLPALLLALFLAVMAWLVFVVALRLPIVLWRSPF
jgi:hypothetical protein